MNELVLSTIWEMVCLAGITCVGMGVSMVVCAVVWDKIRKITNR